MINHPKCLSTGHATRGPHMKMLRRIFLLLQHGTIACGKRLPYPGRLASIHLITLYSVTFFFLLPALCYQMRHSIYFLENLKDRDQQIEMFNAENDKRIQQANLYLQNVFKAGGISAETQGLGNTDTLISEMDKQAIPHFLNEQEPRVDIAITIISVSRNRHKFDSYEPRYLTQTVWHYLHLLSRPDAQHRSVKLFLCNVDNDPATYHELLNLSSIVPTFQRFPNKFEFHINVFEKEKQDYVYCLNASLSWNPSFVLLVEDDSLPRDELFPVMNYVLDYFASDKKGHKTTLMFPDKWYMKLYHPERLLGYWSMEVERIPELASLSLLFGLLVICLYQCLGLRVTIFTNINATWFFLSLYFCLVFIAIGRQNLLELRRLSKYFFMLTPAPSCCTPAILYPSAGAKAVVDYLSATHCKASFAKDMALEEMRYKLGMKAYLLQPNLFKHIGLYSSLRTKILSPSVV